MSCVAMDFELVSRHYLSSTTRKASGDTKAQAPLTVVNTRGFDLPKTGDNGTMMITLAGVLLMAGSVTVLLILNKKKLH